jgi:hypothetical protein
VADRRRTFWCAVAAAAFAGMTACGPSAAPGTEAPKPDPVAGWSDSVCGSVLAFATSATAAPDFAAATDLAAVQRTFSDYLGTLVTGLRDGREALAAAGAPPVATGAGVLDRVRTAMTRLEQDLAGARATVDAADPRDPRAFVASVRQVESTVRAMEVPDVVGELSAVPELAGAARTTPQCRKVRTLAAAAPG